jgi:hypothetical protein
MFVFSKYIHTVKTSLASYTIGILVVALEVVGLALGEYNDSQLHASLEKKAVFKLKILFYYFMYTWNIKCKIEKNTSN